MSRPAVALFLSLAPFAALAQAPTVAVVPLSSQDAELGAGVTDTLETVLAEGGQVALVERARVEKAIDSVTVTGEGGKKLAGITHTISESSAENQLQKIGRETGAQYLVVGSVADLGGKIALNARLSEAANGRVLVARSLSFDNRAGMPAAVRTLAALLVERMLAKTGEATGEATGDAALRQLEQALADALRGRFCGKDALEAGRVESFKAGEARVKLIVRGAQAEESFLLVGPGGLEKGTVSLTQIGKDGLSAKASFVNSGESMALPVAGDLLRREKATFALVPLFSPVALGHDPVALAQGVEDRLADEAGCELVHQDAATVTKYGKMKVAQRAVLGRAGVSAVVELTIEAAAEHRQVVGKVLQLPKGTLRGEFTVPLHHE